MRTPHDASAARCGHLSTKVPDPSTASRRWAIAHLQPRPSERRADLPSGKAPASQPWCPDRGRHGQPAAAGAAARPGRWPSAPPWCALVTSSAGPTLGGRAGAEPGGLGRRHRPALGQAPGRRLPGPGGEAVPGGLRARAAAAGRGPLGGEDHREHDGRGGLHQRQARGCRPCAQWLRALAGS